MLPLVLASLILAAPPAKGLTVPSGFEITEFADSSLANDITCMTIDPKGRIVVAGRSYIRLLIDENNDGRADKAVDVTRLVKDHAMGLLWEGDTLLAVVDNGLWRFRIGPDGTIAAGKPERLRELRTAGEHDAHGIRRGPDGWFYLIAGDHTGIDEKFATLTTSPIRKPVGGCVVRFSPDFKHSEIVADGFRNPYSVDFDVRGFAWTFDADNERCVSLPWYEPTRIYQIAPGRQHGWRAPQQSETWRCPPYFPDIVPPATTAGRGSPTGVVFHKHTAWPIRHRGLFVADWTFGKVWRLRPNSLEQPQPFIESTGDDGFAPTALAVHPKTGDLFVSIGGRGTRGAVYRVRWLEPKSIDFADFDERAEWFTNPKTGALEWRLRPAEELKPQIEFGVEWKDEYAKLLPERAKQRLNSNELARILVELYRHREHFPASVLRAAAQRHADYIDSAMFMAATDLISALPPEELRELKAEARVPSAWLALGYGVRAKDPVAAMDYTLRVIEMDNANRALGDPQMRLRPEWRLQAVRLIQLAVGDMTANEVKAKVWAGYSPATLLPDGRHLRARKALREGYPAGIPDLDREITRTLAVLEDDDLATIAKIVGLLTAGSDPLDDVHHLIVLSRLRGPRKPEWTKTIASALLGLDAKITKLKRNRDRNWPLRIAELHAELARKDPKLNDALLTDAEFGRPDHALFARCPGFDRRGAAEKFVQRAKEDAAFEWDAELVGLLGELPADIHQLSLLRKLAQRGGLDDAALPILARLPNAEDLKLFLAGLTSPRLDLVRQCLTALSKIDPPKDGPTALALVRCLRLLPEGKEADRLREMTAKLLESLSGQKLGTDKLRWANWLARAHPEFARQLGGADGVDVEGWRKRLSKIDWNTGKADRGREVFSRASCTACHSGGQAMGPDLSGAAGRFSRDDLFTAILQPSKEVPLRYRMTQVETTNGKTYQGLIVYEAVDGLILQTGPAQTVRIAGERIESRRLTETSLMPTGLLDKLSDLEISDLYAFLKSLVKDR